MWPPKWNRECSEGGSGECDGSEDGYGYGECGCPCHINPDLPLTIAEVREWHDNLHNNTRGES